VQGMIRAGTDEKAVGAFARVWIPRDKLPVCAWEVLVRQ
jgi:hypothetical protein